MSKTTSLLLIAVLTACSGGLSAEELELALQPLVEAQTELEDFGFLMEAGLSNGEVLNRYPDVSARVRRLLSDFDGSQVPESDQPDVEAYYESLVEIHDQFDDMRSGIREMIYEDGDENIPGVNYLIASLLLQTVDAERDWALQPGDQTEERLAEEGEDEVEDVFEDIEDDLDSG